MAGRNRRCGTVKRRRVRLRLLALRGKPDLCACARLRDMTSQRTAAHAPSSAKARSITGRVSAVLTSTHGKQVRRERVFAPRTSLIKHQTGARAPGCSRLAPRCFLKKYWQQTSPPPHQQQHRQGAVASLWPVCGKMRVTRSSNRSAMAVIMGIDETSKTAK